MINRGVVGCQFELKPAERSREAADKPESAGNPTDFSSRGKRGLQKIFNGGFSVHQNFLISKAR
jgi:hypothetical protein